MTYRAVFNGRVITETPENAVKHVEGNVYFPPDTVNREYLESSEFHTRCNWKLKASYFQVLGEDDVAPDAAFFYPKPWPLARRLHGVLARREGGAAIDVAPSSSGLRIDARLGDRRRPLLLEFDDLTRLRMGDRPRWEIQRAARAYDRENDGKAGDVDHGSGL